MFSTLLFLLLASSLAASQLVPVSSQESKELRWIDILFGVIVCYVIFSVCCLSAIHYLLLLFAGEAYVHID